MNAPRFSRDFLPTRIGSWKQFREKKLIRMVRIDEPFMVDTKDGSQYCKDGWLVMDHQTGYPYAISDKDHRKLFEEVAIPDQHQSKEA